MNITFKPMTTADLELWNRWIQVPEVKDTWFIEGYKKPEEIHKTLKGNGYDYPFIIYLDKTPIGYLVCCDLYAWKIKCKERKGLFTDEEPGTFCIDLFIGESEYLNKGYGTEIVKAFTQKLFDEFHAKLIYIAPATDNKRAIHCYEKAGFTFVKEAFDGVCGCTILKIVNIKS